MLTSDERTAVRNALMLAFSLRVDYRELVPVIFLGNAGEVLPRLPAIPGNDVDAERIITICLGSRWSREPALLSLLLDYLVDRQGHGELAAIRDRVAQLIDPNPDPYRARWLGTTRRPFFDRSALRDTLKSLIEDTASPILLVHAAAGTFGRSYTRELVGHVATGGDRATKTAPVSISRGTGVTYTAEDLTLDILSHASNTESAPPRTDSSYPRAVTRFVCGRLLSTGSKWVVVLDGFGQELRQEVSDTIGLLAATVPTGEFRSSLRLVLVDYPRERLTDVSAADILEETLIPASQVTADELRPALLEIAAARERAGRPSMEADVPDALARILGNVPADGKERLAKLNEQLMKFWSFQP